MAIESDLSDDFTMSDEHRELLRLTHQVMVFRHSEPCSKITEAAIDVAYKALSLALTGHRDPRCLPMLAGLRQHATDCRAAVEATGNLERWEMARDPNLPAYSRLGKREWERRADESRDRNTEAP